MARFSHVDTSARGKMLLDGGWRQRASTCCSDGSGRRSNASRMRRSLTESVMQRQVVPPSCSTFAAMPELPLSQGGSQETVATICSADSIPAASIKGTTFDRWCLFLLLRVRRRLNRWTCVERAASVAEQRGSSPGDSVNQFAMKRQYVGLAVLGAGGCDGERRHDVVEVEGKDRPKNNCRISRPLTLPSPARGAGPRRSYFSVDPKHTPAPCRVGPGPCRARDDRRWHAAMRRRAALERFSFGFVPPLRDAVGADPVNWPRQSIFAAGIPSALRLNSRAARC